MEDITKSIKAYLYERAESPLFPTFIVTWCIWNWKIFYITFFMSESVIGNRLWYIENCLNDPMVNLVAPFASTVLLILVVPLVSNGAFWQSEKFKQWRKNKKRDLEKKTLLTEEQSVRILLDMEKQKIDYANSFTTYETELKREKDVSNKRIDDLKSLYDAEKSNLLTSLNSEKSNLTVLFQTKAAELMESKKETEELTNAISELHKIQRGLRILRAEYGNEGDNLQVTQILQDNVINDTLNITVDSKLLGDPEWAMSKALTVIYMFNNQIHYSFVKENEKLTLPNAETMAGLIFTGTYKKP